MAEATHDDRYEAPRIEERVDITNPLIGNGSAAISATFRPL